MDFLLDFILHIDQYMVMIVRDYHAWTYAILFFIIFCETGLVVTPFLPGDSLVQTEGLRRNNRRSRICRPKPHHPLNYTS